MPTYEYVCTACANGWEEVQKISEAPITVCPKCGESTAKRQISGGNFILKGGGWYADLYSSAKPKTNGESKSGESKSAGAGASASEAKSSSSSESKSSGGGEKAASSGGASAPKADAK